MRKIRFDLSASQYSEIPFMMFRVALLAISSLFLSNALGSESSAAGPEAGWRVDFFDDFKSFDPENWQDQILWVNEEDQCYVRDNEFNTREVSGGTLKLRVVDIGEPHPCDNMDKSGKIHPDTRYVAGRIASKNRKEFVKGKWTARLRVEGNGQKGMFPAWWLLGARNNEPPVQEPDEDVCWPMTGSGEIDIFEHHGEGGAGHYAARIINNLGHCGGGDWESLMTIVDADLEEFHEYSVEWENNDLIFRMDGAEVYRIADHGDDFPEPLFAILNFAKLGDGPVQGGEWVMEVDWVKHEKKWGRKNGAGYLFRFSEKNGAGYLFRFSEEAKKVSGPIFSFFAIFLIHSRHLYRM